MGMTFTKLFSSITESTVWCEPSDVRVVWISMLAMADRNGCVFASIPGLANRARVPIESTEAALSKFQQPDPYSRTTEFEGRRIEVIDGGWRLLNYMKYRKLRDDEATKEAKRTYINNRRSAEREAEYQSRLAEFPTADEVVAHGQMINCSPDSCRKFHVWYSEKKMWLNVHGQLIDWKSALVRWREKEKTVPQKPQARVVPFDPDKPRPRQLTYEELQKKARDELAEAIRVHNASGADKLPLP